MEVVPVGPTNVAVPSTTRWIDPQATSFGSIPDVCARRVDAVVVGKSRLWREGIISVNPAKEDTTGQSGTPGRACADDGDDGRGVCKQKSSGRCATGSRN